MFQACAVRDSELGHDVLDVEFDGVQAHAEARGDLTVAETVTDGVDDPPLGGREYVGVAWPAASGVGLLACALLVVNNLRDIPTDAAAGKRTLAVRIGDRWTRRLYLALVAGAIVLACVCASDRPWSAMAAFAGIVAIVPVRRVLASATGRELIAVLGATGRVQLAYGALLTIGLALG